MAQREGNRLEKLRRMQGLSLEDVASARGKSRSTIHNWERNVGQIPDEHKLALAELFGVTVTFLMGWDRRVREDDNGDNGAQERVA